jgi:hypothetical protein
MLRRRERRARRSARRSRRRARGEAVVAIEAFERAGAIRHAADSEMGLVRAAMQLGDYPRALAFCAHVAGEHLDALGAAVLYAWLLRVGGQREVAERVLREASERAPGDPVVGAAVRALAALLPEASAELLATPHRVAPFAIRIAGERPPPATAHVVSSGVVLAGGRHALVPGRPQAQSVWVRNGLGATREATFDGDADGGMTRWRWAVSVDGVDEAVIGRAPVAGMPVFAAEYAETAPATPAWPWLRAGFLGAVTRDGDAFRLGADIAAARAGGPVLDRAGRVVGVVVRDADGRATMRPITRGPATMGTETGTAAGDRGRANLPLADLAADQIYERALRAAIQVIAAP